MEAQPDQLQVEHDAFQAALGGLLEDHPGEFVIFQGGQPTGFFPSFDAAYGAALERYGLDAVFLVDRISRQQVAPASLSWELAVL